MPLPPKLILPLPQYHGDTGTAVVDVGEAVLKYQVLARHSTTGIAQLHAPTSGQITAIDNSPIAGVPGSAALCIHLQCDGQDKALELTPFANYQDLTGAELRQEIDAAGIVGMGGAGFPLAQKLQAAITRGIELVIINAAECEPYISTDEALLRERAQQVVAGADILRAASHAPRCVIVIEDDKTDAIAALKAALDHSSIEILLLHSAYPGGGEKQIVQAVTGLEVPAGDYPIALGIIVHNAGTAYAAYQAVVEGKPCISRVTTLTGSALQTPKNFDALIGTSIEFLLQLCGVDTAIHTSTMLGGSLMGTVLERTDVAITKTGNCVIAASADEFPPPAAERACIRCGFCAEVCPAQLLPQQLYNFARAHKQDQLHTHGLQDCIECGACAYVCPSKIPLVQYYVAAKQEILDDNLARQQGEKWQSRFQFHQYRVKRDKEFDRTRKLSPTDSMPSTTASDGPPATPANFSRTQAQQEIADAVARAKARKASLKSSTASAPGDSE